MLEYIASRYNFVVPATGSVLLYNVSSGGLLRFGPGDGEDLARLLVRSPAPRIRDSSLPADVMATLRDGGFIVPLDADEVAVVRDRFWHARNNAPIVATITVTQDCNLRCFYCYEERSTDRLASGDISTLLARIEVSLANTSRRDLHVDWYGGEPMLNAHFIEEASTAIQSMCAERNVLYSASIISNGTQWPNDPAAFVLRHKIREVQISFDGGRRHHEKYRAHRKISEPSSFDDAVRVVDALCGICKVSVRLNLDRQTVRSADEFLLFASARGWFTSPNRAVLQPARLAAFTDRSEFMSSWQFSVTEFEDVKRAIRARHGKELPIEEAETIDGFPRPRRSVCAALGNASFVVGADRLEYRCGLQVGESGRAMGLLTRGEKRRLPIAGDTHSDEEFWRTFDPTTRPRCRGCSFLPVCWSGCPKRHLEQNQAAIDEYGQYWRENLARLVTAGIGEALREDCVYSAEDQFRA